MEQRSDGKATNQSAGEKEKTITMEQYILIRVSTK